jgi:HSP20 family molecular chaperone IbpA
MNENKDVVKRAQVNPELTRKLQPCTPAVDIHENEEEILLYVDMPGVIKEDISVNIENGKLLLSGVRMVKNTGSQHYEEFGDVEYRRLFSVPQTIAVENVRAELNKGVLILHLPKAETAKPKKIEIKAA